ncbi:armadillo repeat-containing protein 3 [Dunckerocampus dactyliophorus]|uniref:armadillo repeat-containing protein 3 n=1 Tax=Dunckerocampus dactyliophorus TaxID=161453 RepID=UPI0024049AC4|nr:armadillo repeat-containing protein 3 [Dunckerocampus dactyliophorus]
MVRRNRRNNTDSESSSRATFESLRVEFKTPATAVLLLGSPEEDILIVACEAIYEFAEEGDANKVNLMELGALEALGQLINHSNKIIRRNAIIGLGVMATNSTVRSTLQNINVIPSIIGRLSLDDTAIHEFGTLCLSCLSTEPCCKLQIVDNKGLPLLLKLLSNSDPDVQKNSLETIYNLVEDEQICPALMELRGISNLLLLLKSAFSIIQLLALKTLHKLAAKCKDTQSTFREEAAFDIFINILNDKDLTDLHAETLQVLAYCMSDIESFKVIQDTGGIATLTELVLTTKLSEGNSTSLKCSNNEIPSLAVNCIARAAQNSDLHQFLHDQKVEKVLVDFLSSGANDGAKTYACEAVATLSSFLPSKDVFRDLGGIPAVVRLLKAKSSVIRDHVIQTLANLTSGNSLNTMAVYKAGGHKMLVLRLSDTCPKLVANSVAILGRMAAQEEIRCKVISQGVVPALVDPLKSTDTEVLISTLLCICELAFEEEAREKLQSAGCLEPMVSLLRSSHMEVLRCACMAVSVCAKDEPTALEMCHFGALEILQEINLSINRRSKFTEYALISLLKYNLSLKYRLLGYLTTGDTITNGFYDTGKVWFGQKVLTLEELSMEPIDEERPVIVINSNVSDEAQQKNEAQSQSSQERNSSMDDVSLQFLVKEVKESELLLKNEEEQYAALAWYVSAAMGGAIEREELDTFAWTQHLDELKHQVECNVIPIGMIRKGIHCHRALLFKYLADCIGMRCTLVRGEYNRAWNEVLIYKGDSSSNENSSQPCCYIVDLMHQPGNLLEVNSPAASDYQSL